jgi:hypothetical protein
MKLLFFKKKKKKKKKESEAHESANLPICLSACLCAPNNF